MSRVLWLCEVLSPPGKGSVLLWEESLQWGKQAGFDHQLTEESGLTPSSPQKDFLSVLFINSIVDFSAISVLRSLTSTRAHAGQKGEIGKESAPTAADERWD